MFYSSSASTSGGHPGNQILLCISMDGKRECSRILGSSELYGTLHRYHQLCFFGKKIPKNLALYSFMVALSRLSRR